MKYKFIEKNQIFFNLKYNFIYYHSFICLNFMKCDESSKKLIIKVVIKERLPKKCL